MCVCVSVVHSAFDTLAKVFSPPEDEVEQRLAEKSHCVSGTTIQLIGRDQETPIIEVEGPLLTDSHVGFKVLLVKQLLNLVMHISLTSSRFDLYN